jgi:hypothetical protein
MVHCSTCTVENASISCGNAPRLCYACCIKPGVATCPFHYNILPVIARQARADALAGVAEGGQPPPAAPALDDLASSAALHGGPPPALDAQPPPPAQSTEASLVALTALLTTISMRLASLEADRQSVASPANVPPSLLPATAPVPTLPSVATSTTVPPPHRQAVLNPSLSANALTNLYDNLEIDSDDDDTTRERKTDVSTQLTHSTLTLANVFPPSLASAPVGSAEDGQQQLARLLSAFHKTGSTVKYATLAELSEALNDWYTAASKAKWPHDRLKAIYDYRSFVIDDIGRQSSLAHAVKYHTLFAKAVQSGEHSLFAPRGFFDPLSYIKVFPHGTTSTSTSSASQGDKKPPRDKKKKGSATGTDKTFTAGSCANHPLSTTHNTSMCKKK